MPRTALRGAWSLALAVGATASAQLTWDPGLTPAAPAGGAGTWDGTTANWSNGTSDVAWSANTAVFGGTGGAVTVSGTHAVTGLTLASSGYTLSGGTLDIGGGATFGIGGSFSGPQTINSTIAGSGTLSVNGANTIAIMVLGGTNTYSGGTSISGSVRLRATNSSSLGTGPITFASGLSNELILDNGVTLGQNIVASVPARISVNSGTAHLTGAVSGNSAINSSLVKNGAGTLVVSGANTYAGPTSVGTGGTLALGASHVLSAATFYLNSGTFALNGYDETVGALAFTSGSIDFGAGFADLAFGASAGQTWSANLLNILNFTPGSDTLRFGSDASGLTSAQLGKIRFGSIGAQIDALGYVTPVPEPAAGAALAGLAAHLGARLRYRRRRRGIPAAKDFS